MCGRKRSPDNSYGKLKRAKTLNFKNTTKHSNKLNHFSENFESSMVLFTFLQIALLKKKEKLLKQDLYHDLETYILHIMLTFVR